MLKKLIQFLLLVASSLAMAQNSHLPQQIVEFLYAPYVSGNKVSSLDLILPYASSSLHAAIKKDQ
jgi:hypothetical protein